MFATFIALFTCAVSTAVSTAHCLACDHRQEGGHRVPRRRRHRRRCKAEAQPRGDSYSVPHRPAPRPFLIPGTPSLPGLDGFVNHFGCWMVLGVVGLAVVLVVHASSYDSNLARLFRCSSL
ncbi:hypothetical protein C8J57DRAFT_51162 [Mycena rebaudengoi]|nr:hypothetical protein C8J57DRAFT_51162 [Mycena rebaudengoi]